MPGRFFICYRRDDSGGHAGRVYDRLEQHFPGDVFRDVDSIHVLNRWEHSIDETLGSCEVAIVVIGKRWLERGADQTRRLDRSDDPVRKELVALLEGEVKIVPLLVGGASLPERDELPDPLKAVTEWQAIRIDDDDFDHDMGRLITALEERPRAGRSVNERPARGDRAKPRPRSRREPSSEPTPSEAPGGQEPFVLGVEDVFPITGRGTVVTGKIASGRIRVGDEVEIVGIRATQTAHVRGIEESRRLLDEAGAGHDVGILLSSNIGKDDVQRGQALATVGALQAATNLVVDVHVLSPAEGGAARAVSDGERLNFWIRTVAVPGTVSVPTGQIDPGENWEALVRLTQPMAVAKGLRIALLRDDQTIGAGTVRQFESSPA